MGAVKLCDLPKVLALCDWLALTYFRAHAPRTAMVDELSLCYEPCPVCGVQRIVGAPDSKKKLCYACFVAKRFGEAVAEKKGEANPVEDAAAALENTAHMEYLCALLKKEVTEMAVPAHIAEYERAMEEAERLLGVAPGSGEVTFTNAKGMPPAVIEAAKEAAKAQGLQGPMEADHIASIPHDTTEPPLIIAARIWESADRPQWNTGDALTIMTMVLEKKDASVIAECSVCKEFKPLAEKGCCFLCKYDHDMANAAPHPDPKVDEKYEALIKDIRVTIQKVPPFEAALTKGMTCPEVKAYIGDVSLLTFQMMAALLTMKDRQGGGQ